MSMLPNDVEVVTVWSPHPEHPKWRNDYLNLIKLQRETVLHFRHKHLVVTDAEDLPPEFETMKTPLSKELMPAMIDGVIARLAAPVMNDLVFVDVDVLVNRNLNEAFDGNFDLGLTRRVDVKAPINNGAMYVSRHGALHALRFFLRARELCGTHWGADQEAISAAAAPVPEVERTEIRDGMRLAFLPIRKYNVSPKGRRERHKSNPFVIHFKGVAAKEWAYEYATEFIFNKAASWV